LAELGADIITADEQGRTPLLIASNRDRAAVVEVLAELGANINTPSPDGSSLVYVAAVQNSLNVIKVLHKLGADINTPVLKESRTYTPVLAAAGLGHKATVKLLYKLGADMKPCSSSSSSIITMAELSNLDGDNAKAMLLIEKKTNKMTKECEFCGCSSKRLKVCSKCEKVRYCSRECQVKDHKKHRKECFPSAT
jgi:ankyrin repeat protein